MSLQQQDEETITVYTKLNCPYCENVKILLNTKPHYNVVYIPADEYLNTDEKRTDFLEFIRNKTGGINHRTFPMVFRGSEFLGGFTETKQWFLDNDF